MVYRGAKERQSKEDTPRLHIKKVARDREPIPTDTGHRGSGTGVDRPAERK